jgi:hypothetical protein
MKKAAVFIIPVLLLFLVVAFAFQQTYDISWWSIDGGAGTSVGNGFAVSGIIGQPDAGPAMTGGSYAVGGGYWNATLDPVTPDDEILFLPLLMR